jgi:nitrogen fixation protein NifU and related proteins
MNDAREMYKEHILELYKEPSNFGTLENATHRARANNPICGDDITLEVEVNNNKVENIKFKGKGCAISIAGASLLTDEVKGKNIDEVRKINSETVVELLEIPIGPVRLKCANLSLRALQEALFSEGKNGIA